MFTNRWRLERWLSREEPVLLQRARVVFLSSHMVAHTNLEVQFQRNLMLPSDLLIHSIHTMHIHTLKHTHTNEKQVNLFKF